MANPFPTIYATLLPDDVTLNVALEAARLQTVLLFPGVVVLGDIDRRSAGERRQLRFHPRRAPLWRQFFSGSLPKVAAMYAAFELRNAVNRPPPAQVGMAAAAFDHLRAEFDATIRSGATLDSACTKGHGRHEGAHVRIGVRGHRGRGWRIRLRVQCGLFQSPPRDDRGEQQRLCGSVRQGAGLQLAERRAGEGRVLLPAIEIGDLARRHRQRRLARGEGSVPQRRGYGTAHALFRHGQPRRSPPQRHALQPCRRQQSKRCSSCWPARRTWTPRSSIIC